MKKTLFAISMMTLLYACGGGEDKKAGQETTQETTPPADDITQHPDYQKGLALIAKSDCLTCHKVAEPLTGPMYRDVANKYAGMPDTIISHLASKIISGGSGVWGQVAMTPHPTLPKEDAEAMVKYILLLKK